MSIDAELVTRKMVLIASDLEALRPLLAKGRDHHLQNRLEQAVVERLLERIIGRMIDINYHVITETGGPPPSDYYASFLRLGELRILSVDFARQIARSAGLRNRLVHEYDVLDAGKVFNGLEAALHDVPVYLRGINHYVAETQNRFDS